MPRRNNASDDFFNAMSNYRPTNPSDQSPSAPQYPQFQGGFVPTPLLFSQTTPFDYQQYQQFQQFQLAQQQQFQPFQQPEMEADVQPDPETEPEPEGSRRRKKGKQTAKEVGKKATTKKPWTAEQERLLTECYIDVSEDPRRGTSQTGAHFWTRIQEKFNARSDAQRTRDQLSSKWRQIRIDVGKFVAIFSGYDRNRHSGEDDLQVMEQSRKAYLLEVGKPFNLYDCFRILQEKPKFLAPAPVDVMGRSLSKRKPYINLEEDEDEEENVNLGDPPTEHELFGRDPIDRPAGGGRNKSQRHSGSSDATSSHSSSAELQATLDRLGNKRAELYDTKKTALEKIVEEEKKRTMFAAFLFLESGTPSEEERRFLQKAKKSVMNEYKHLIQDSDDEN